MGDHWRRRYDSLLLNTPAQYDGLPGQPFERTAAAASRPAPRWATTSSGTPTATTWTSVTGSSSRRIDRLDGGGFRLTCSDGTLYADNVVVATGGEHHPNVPDVARALDPGIRQLHS